MRELGSPKMTISGTQDIIRAFTRLSFIIAPIPVAKLSNDTTVIFQISCLPKFSIKQQFRLADVAFQGLGFSSAEISLDVGDKNLQRRSYIKAVHQDMYITYHIDLGLLEIFLGA